jgi:hypothetical protein
MLTLLWTKVTTVAPRLMPRAKARTVLASSMMGLTMKESVWVWVCVLCVRECVCRCVCCV